MTEELTPAARHDLAMALEIARTGVAAPYDMDDLLHRAHRIHNFLTGHPDVVRTGESAAPAPLGDGRLWSLAPGINIVVLNKIGRTAGRVIPEEVIRGLDDSGVQSLLTAAVRDIGATLAVYALEEADRG